MNQLLVTSFILIGIVVISTIVYYFFVYHITRYLLNAKSIIDQTRGILDEIRVSLGQLGVILLKVDTKINIIESYNPPSTEILPSVRPKTTPRLVYPTAPQLENTVAQFPQNFSTDQVYYSTYVETPNPDPDHLNVVKTLKFPQSENSNSPQKISIPRENRIPSISKTTFTVTPQSPLAPPRIDSINTLNPNQLYQNQIPPPLAAIGSLTSYKTSPEKLDQSQNAWNN